MRKNRLAPTSLFLKSLTSTASNSVTSCFYWLAFVSVRMASYKSDQPALNSGARTRTNAAGVEQRACRAGPEGVSRRAANNRTKFDGESIHRKAKTQP